MPVDMVEYSILSMLYKYLYILSRLNLYNKDDIAGMLIR